MNKQIKRIESADKVKDYAKRSAERNFNKIDFRKARRYGKKYLREFVDNVLLPPTKGIIKEAKNEAE